MRKETNVKYEVFFTFYKRVNERWKKALCTYIYIIYICIYVCFCCLHNTDVLLDAKYEAITVFVVTPDDSFYFAAVVCVVENLAESDVV